MFNLIPTMTRSLKSKTPLHSSFDRLGLVLNHLGASRSHTRSYTSVSIGAKFSTKYKNYALNDSNKVISYFHDIPLNLDVENGTATMVVEVPRWSNAKFEIDTKATGNPIVQDVKKGQVRFVRNLFPYNGYIHNYGAFPQTWEDPTQKSGSEDLYGDGDPLDVCEIGSAILQTGQVTTVKILGSLALVDDGELDWKIIVINTQDPLAKNLSDIEDVSVHCPGLLDATRQWFRDYKLADGKAKNVFALGGQYRNQKETIETILECRAAWDKLVTGKSEASGFAIDNITLKGTPKNVESFSFNEEVLASKPEAETEIPADIFRSFYF